MATEPDNPTDPPGPKLSGAESVGPELDVRTMQDEILRGALARGMSYREAGEFAGVSQRTVARRMSDPAFARDVAQMRSEFLSVVTGQLMSAGPEALAVLRACLTEERPSDRRMAANDLLRLGLAYRSHGDLEAEVAALRAQLEALTGGDD